MVLTSYLHDLENVIKGICHIDVGMRDIIHANVKKNTDVQLENPEKVLVMYDETKLRPLGNLQGQDPKPQEQQTLWA